MTHSTVKTVLATVAIVIAGGAFAQGTQPNANVANPATGAGQQSQQGTPMGTTGVLPSNKGGATTPNNTMNTTPSSNMSNDSERMAPQRRMRAARADRN
jgi:hypothetical protein